MQAKEGERDGRYIALSVHIAAISIDQERGFCSRSPDFRQPQINFSDRLSVFADLLSFPLQHKVHSSTFLAFNRVINASVY